MRIGAGLSMPWMADLDGLRRAAIALDEAGFDHLTSSGHLLTAEEGRYPQLPAFTYALPYRDPFVLFSHLAALTSAIHFRTAIFILPMFPTALVAKQSADLSLLSGGRFELGVGLSWQEAEYRALGQPMRDRGRKLEEQITVLRKLWTEPSVTFSGRYHEIDDLGLGQLPEAHIPIWIGSSPTEGPLKRAAAMADGWMPGGGVPDAEPARLLGEYLTAAGRTDEFRIAGRVTAAGDVAATLADARRQIADGATEITVAPPLSASVDEALPMLIEVKRELDSD